MSEPMLPFDDEDASTVRLKADTTYVTAGIADVGSVRLPTSAPIVVRGATAGRQPDRDGPPKGGHYVR